MLIDYCLIDDQLMEAAGIKWPFGAGHTVQQREKIDAGALVLTNLVLKTHAISP